MKWKICVSSSFLETFVKLSIENRGLSSGKSSEIMANQKVESNSSGKLHSIASSTRLPRAIEGHTIRTDFNRISSHEISYQSIKSSQVWLTSQTYLTPPQIIQNFLKAIKEIQAGLGTKNPQDTNGYWTIRHQGTMLDSWHQFTKDLGNLQLR